MLAMGVNDNVGYLDTRVALRFIASKLAPANQSTSVSDRLGNPVIIRGSFNAIFLQPIRANS
ncbi:hypothetical protein ACW9HW_16985 [Pseudomonas sp. SDO5532_S415]|uniref:hypothetical protein n=1 Tax=Pseudomonas sp. Irchel 3A7 TaxID=2008913 RepID=UPI000BA2BE00|nr:hypothetical protein [Pseudomonas sp. Irchel 3A7]